MFEFLFKYRPVVFERGDFTLALPVWVFLVALLVIVVAVAFLLRYRDVGPAVPPRDRWILGLLRAGVLGILAFALFRPTLVVSTVVPRHNYLAVLLDDSRSMRIADEDGARRGERMLELFGPAAPDSAEDAGRLVGPLSERFRVRTWAFGADAVGLDPADSLRFGEDRTGLGRALSRVRQEMDGLPLSGIVLVTDGADNGDAPPTEALADLRASGVPVYPVALGAERIAPDVEVRRVELPRRALVGTTVVADVILSHAGMAGRRVRLDVEDDGRLLGSQDVELGIDGETPVQVQLRLDDIGAREIRVVVVPGDDEAVTENNERSLVLDVRDERRKILHFEGVPRPELKFVRRALADDEQIQLVTLLRSADEKYLRLGVDDAEELIEGFPATREELYRYDGLVLGDVEASFFTHDQLQMIADFVSRRGGGLLALGGPRAFAEGGYAGTPLADALPIVLDAADDSLVDVAPDLTPAGRRHPAMRVADDEAASAERWSTLPALTTRNAVTRVKPGAVTLVSGRTPAGDERVLLAHQRFGRGTSVAFVTQDSWLWQMHADIPLEDRTHEILWSQLLRWLVHDTPGRLELDLDGGTVAVDEPFTLRATLEDERFLRVNGSSVAATVTGPDGVPVELPLAWTVERDGEYETTFTPTESGVHRVDLRAGEGEDAIAASGYVRAGRPQRESFGAGRRTDLLRRIAEETGGRFYTAASADALPEEIVYSESGDTVLEAHPLWDMPILLLLLGLLLTGEWVYRNRKELA